MQKKIWLMLSLVGCLTLLVGSAFWLCRKTENAVKKLHKIKGPKNLLLGKKQSRLYPLR